MVSGSLEVFHVHIGRSGQAGRIWSSSPVFWKSPTIDRLHLHDLVGFSNEASKKTGSHK